MSSDTSRHATVRRSARPLHNGVDTRLGEMYARIGLDARAAMIRYVFDRSAVIDNDRSVVAVDLREAEVRAVFAVNGGATLAEALREFDAAKRDALSPAAARDLAEKCKHQLHYDAAMTLHREGDALIHELDQVVQTAVARLSELAPLIGSINSDSDALRAGAEASQAWSELLDQCERITTAQSIAQLLRLAEIVPTVVEAGELNWTRRDPDVVVDHDEQRHPARTMIALIDAGAGPCCATAQEVIDEVYGHHKRAG